MNYWNIIGITPTKDKDKIKKAYMNKLSVVNPEDDAEGFKELRNAYEVLLKECDLDTEEDDSEVGRWIKKITDLYNTFSLRLKEEEWQKLLNDEVCYSLDSKEECSERLLEFLMDHCYIPQKIWGVLNDFFNWVENKEELSEKFPKDYLQYVENRINYNDALNYYLFEDIDDEKDYEEWIRTYFKINGSINDKELDKARKNLEKIAEFNIKHPHLEVLKMRYLMDIEEYEKALEIGNVLIEKYPDDARIVFAEAEVKWLLKEYEEAEKNYKKVLEILPDDYNASLGIADCKFEMGEFEEAKKLYGDLINRNIYDGYARKRQMEVNDKLIEKYKGEQDLDGASKLKFGWCLYENFRYEEIVELIKDIEVNEEDENQLCDLSGRTYAALENYKESIVYFKKWLKNLEEKDGEEKNIRQLNYCLYQIGRQYSNLKEYEEAIKYYDKALENNKGDIDSLNYKGEALLNLGKYEESLDVIDKALEIDNSFVNLYINKAKDLYELGYHGDALEACFNAEEIYPYDYDIYVLEMKLYYAHDEYDNMLEVYEKASKLEMVNDEINLYKIRALNGLEKYDESKELIINLLKTISKNGDNYRILDEVYYEFSLLYSDMDKPVEAMKYIEKAIKISNKPKFYYSRAYYYLSENKYHEALADYDYVIEKYPYNISAYIREAQIYRELENLDKSIDLYKKVLEINPEHEYVNDRIAAIYEQKDDFDNALKYYNKQIEVNKQSYFLIDRGIFYDRYNMTDKAIADYEEAIKLEPENSDAYNNIGYIYIKRREYNKAIKYLEKAIEYMDDPYIQVFNNLGKCYKRLRRYDDALKCYSNAIKYFPDSERLYKEKGDIYTLMHKYKDAINVFVSALRLEGDHVLDFYKDIAKGYTSLENYDEAMDWYEKVLKEDPNDNMAYEGIGIVYSKKGYYEEALKYFLKQIKIDNHPYDYIKAAEIYTKMGRNLKARRYYKKAIDLYKKFQSVGSKDYLEMARCCRNLGKRDEAIKYCNKAIALWCNDGEYFECHEAYYELGQVAEENKEYITAFEYYLKAKEIVTTNDSYEEGVNRMRKILKK